MVVGSSTGEFESGFEAGGQTREHALLVRSLGVTQIVVAVNKLDNVSVLANIKYRQTGPRTQKLIAVFIQGVQCLLMTKYLCFV